MDASDLFDLGQFGWSYQGLMADKDLFLWRKERRGDGYVFRRLACQTEWPSYNKFPLSLSDFKDTISKMPIFIEFIKEQEERSKTLKGRYIIGLVDSSGAVVFSSKPIIFNSMDEVKKEIESKGSMGNKVAVFQCTALAEIKNIEWE